jgi:membrane-associated protein
MFAIGLSVENIIQSGGLLLIGLIIFAESGILAGFFLPGDTLLLSAGYFASIGRLPLGWLLLVVAVAAVVGDNVGYELGRRFGPRLFRKKESAFFHPDQLLRAQDFYERHGGKTIVLARFVPVVRTFAPVVAGAGKMDHKRFMMFNLIGATVWGVGVTLLGYFLGKVIGSRVADIDRYIMLILAAAMAITIGPALYHLLKAQITRRRNARGEPESAVEIVEDLQKIVSKAERNTASKTRNKK